MVYIYIYIYTHTHTQNLTLQEKMIMKKLHMNSLNLLQSQKVLTQKRNKHIDKKAHSINLKIQVVILTHPMVCVPLIETGSKYHSQIKKKQI